MKLVDFLAPKTVDDLKKLAGFCGCSMERRKQDLIDCIQRKLLDPTNLKKIWEKLDYLSQKAVSTAYYNDSEFSETAFLAQYGSLPERPKSPSYYWYFREPIALDLIIHQTQALSIIPEDLMPLLENLVHPPDRYQISGLTAAPKTVADLGGQPIELQAADTEQTGLHDLVTYLRLVDQDKMNVTAKSGRATGGSIQQLAANLLVGDFFPQPDKLKAAETIRPFGLDVFARESKLVLWKRNKLELSEAGREFYRSQDPDILLDAFETWAQAGYFDELNRIGALKGINSSGTWLTKAAKRREAVIEALSWCPAGVWIDIEDFYRAMKIWQFDFDVEENRYSNLYIFYKEFGSLHGEAYWRIVKGLYINVVLWEYLATIGALDLRYLAADEVDLTAEYEFAQYYDYDGPISLYDGLKYFRINNLGAFLLGQASEYVPSARLDRTLFTVSPDLRVSIPDPAKMTPNDWGHLGQMATPVSGDQNCYQLDTQQILTTLENGGDLQFLDNFLRDHHASQLPEPVSTWLAQIAENLDAFSLDQQAIMIKVKSPELVDKIMDDPILKKFCQPYNRKTLVMPLSRLTTFRKRLKELEYIVRDQ